MPHNNPFTITYDDEDLTEIESSDEEEPSPPPPPVNSAPARAKSTRPSTQTATEKSRARGGLQTVAPTLKPYRSTTYSTASLNEWMSCGLLDLDAEYQRGVVWNEAKQIGLIDSIFRNYYIPPVVFTVTQTPDGNEKRVCIDGKQRLTSIRRFILGEIPYKDVTTNRKTWFTSPPGARRKLITLAMQNTFRNKQITCSEYDSVTQEQEREIFQRVQMGMTLGPADRLPAINGPYADLVRGLRRKIEKTEGFGAYHNWGEARGRDFQALTQIVYLMSHGTEPKKSEPTAMRLEAFLSQNGVDVSALERNAQQVLDVFISIAQHPVLSKPLQGALAPLEFVMAFYLIFKHRSYLNEVQLSAAIYHMRQKFREICPNRKVNTTVFKNILNFVLVHVRKLKLDLPEDPLGHDGIKTDPSKSSISHIGGGSSGHKRKQVERDQDDSDAEYTIPVKKKANVAPKAEPKSSVSAPVASSSKAHPLKSKLESRLAPKSSAKTTIRRTSNIKKPASTSTSASAPARKPSVASSISSNPSASVSTHSPTIKPSFPRAGTSSLPSSRRNSLAPESSSVGMVPSSSGQSISSVATSWSSATTTTSNTHVGQPTARPLPLPGRSPAVRSPLVPNFSPHFVSGQHNTVNAGNVADTLVSLGQDRLGGSTNQNNRRTLSAAAIPSGSGSVSMDNAHGHGEASSHPAVASAAPRPKYPKFTKKYEKLNVDFSDVGLGPKASSSAAVQAPNQVPNPIHAQATAPTTTTNTHAPSMVPGQAGLPQHSPHLQQQAQLPKTVSTVQPGSHHPQLQQQQQQKQSHPLPMKPISTVNSNQSPNLTNKSLTQVLGVVQPPTRDPRPRPPSLRQVQDMPTPPQSSVPVPPQIPDQQLAMLSLSGGQVLGARALPGTSSTADLGQQPPLKRMRGPCPPYPGPGNQS